MARTKINPELHTADIDSIILDLWRNVGHGDVFASKAVAETFARHPQLAPAQRETIVTTVYGMLSHARRISHALSPDKQRLPPKVSKALAELLAYRVLEERLPAAKAQAKIPVIDWNAVLAADAAVANEPDAAKRIGVTASLPDFLAQRIAVQYGAEAERVARGLGQPAPLTLRVNTLKTTREEVLGELTAAGLKARPAEHSSAGIELLSHADVFSLSLFEQGYFEIQDEASQLVAELTAPPLKGLVIDYCAGAGGKTLALGALMRNKGRLIALDVHARKLQELQRRARRAGLSNLQTMLLEGEWPPQLRRFSGKADRVLVDVPCSGLGAFRRKPEMRWRLSAEDLERLPREQEAIARRAMQLLAPGGRLIYATCTILREENESVIERLLGDTQFERVPVKEVLGKEKSSRICDSSGMFLQLLPHQHGCDGFFAAILRRKR